jgi:hypothetical protein
MGILGDHPGCFVLQPQSDQRLHAAPRAAEYVPVLCYGSSSGRALAGSESCAGQEKSAGSFQVALIVRGNYYQICDEKNAGRINYEEY